MVISITILVCFSSFQSSLVHAINQAGALGQLIIIYFCILILGWQSSFPPITQRRPFALQLSYSVTIVSNEWNSLPPSDVCFCLLFFILPHFPFIRVNLRVSLLGMATAYNPKHLSLSLSPRSPGFFSNLICLSLLPSPAFFKLSPYLPSRN